MCQKAYVSVSVCASTCHNSLISLLFLLLRWLEAESSLSLRLTPAVDAALWLTPLTVCRQDFSDTARSLSPSPPALHGRSEFEAPNYCVFAPRVCSNMSYHEPSAALYL